MVQDRIIQYYYFRERQVSLPECARRVLLRECTAAVRQAAAAAAENVEPSAEAAGREFPPAGLPLLDAVTEEELTFYRFLRMKHVGGLTEVIVRSPRSALSFTVVKTRGGDYARVLAILRFRDRGYLLLRWYTFRFEDCGPGRRPTDVCRLRYPRVKSTNSVVVEQLDHIAGTVGILPDWDNPEVWYINISPLGTTLQSRAWETALALQEGGEIIDDEEVEQCAFGELATMVADFVV